ncbi:hypothetical protein LCGC14_2104660 [marine sediment metagenome]|uniref:Uncharacterized protein n=1 Tax=marine sediment metagenome TaxID=412755 RepID=A0A0F9H5A9_9ZZZZ
MSSERQEVTLIETLGDHMAYKLRVNQDKPHWLDEEKWRMFHRLSEEVQELRGALLGTSVEAVWHEAADVANFAAFVADIFQRDEELR